MFLGIKLFVRWLQDQSVQICCKTLGLCSAGGPSEYAEEEPFCYWLEMTPSLTWAWRRSSHEHGANVVTPNYGWVTKTRLALQTHSFLKNVLNLQDELDSYISHTHAHARTRYPVVVVDFAHWSVQRLRCFEAVVTVNKVHQGVSELFWSDCIAAVLGGDGMHNHEETEQRTANNRPEHPAIQSSIQSSCSMFDDLRVRIRFSALTECWVTCSDGTSMPGVWRHYHDMRAMRHHA